MNHRSFAAVAALALVGGAGAACFSSSSSPSPDVADLDAAVPDSGVPSPEAAPPMDATVDVALDATVEATVDASPDEAAPEAAPPEAGVDAPADVVDAGAPADAPTDANDAASDGGADAGAGSVTTLTGQQLGTTRQEHTSTLLANGHVLICGGYYGTYAGSSTCDDFNPTNNTISAGPSMKMQHRDHTATLLPSGQVLIAGGNTGVDANVLAVTPLAEIYDPAGPSFTIATNHMVQARGGPAVLLTTGANAGKVVFVGGYGDGTTLDGGTTNDTALDSVEVFDPGSNAVNGTFTLLAAHLGTRRGSLAAAGLPEGGLLAAGGGYGPGGGPYTYLATGETLDPALSAFTATADAMAAPRLGASSVTLTDGRIFIFDGSGSTGGGSAFADIYDPASRTFTQTPSLPSTREYAAIAVLKSGRVMIAGGYTAASGTVGDVIVYDPLTNAFLSTTGALNPPRTFATATTLNDGRVLIAGGQTSQGFTTTAVDIFSE